MLPCEDSKLLQSALLEIFNDFEMSIAEQFMTADLLMTKSQNARGNLTYREFHQLVSGLKKPASNCVTLQMTMMRLHFN